MNEILSARWSNIGHYAFYISHTCSATRSHTPSARTQVLLLDRVSTSIAAGLLLAFVNDERNAKNSRERNVTDTK